MNLKKLYRLYREEGLAVRRRRGRRRAIGTRAPLAVPQAANQRWSLDFVADQLTNGRRFRILTVVDDFTRECLALVPDTWVSRIIRQKFVTSRRRRRKRVKWYWGLMLAVFGTPQDLRSGNHLPLDSHVLSRFDN
jgi:putative transposase